MIASNSVAVGLPQPKYIALQYEKLMQDSYVLEEAGDSVAFENQYAQATRLVLDIVDKAQNLSNEEYRRHSNNVIAFVGERGTGKTSAMITFLQALKTFCGDPVKAADNRVFPCGLEETYPEATRQIEQAKFVTLKCIDAATLKAHDDIIEIILARMLRYFMSYEKETSVRLGGGRQEQARLIYQKFDSLFRNLRYLRGNSFDSIDEGESALRALRDLSSSQSVTEEFSNLIKCYLDYFDMDSLENSREFHRKSFLVIALDDIDRYAPNGGKANQDVSTLLDEIYDFLMLPRVIVLVSTTEQLLRHGCIRHLKNVFGLDTEATEKSTLKKVSNQFISKILPTYCRVNMPDFEKAIWNGTDDSPSLAIFLAPKMIRELRLRPNEPVMSKKLTLLLLAKRAGVYFDAKGIKSHFFEQRNLRSLHDFLKVLERMDDNVEHPKAQLNNRKQLLDYITTTFCQDKLASDELEYFQKLLGYPIQRRSLLIFNKVCEGLKRTDGSDESSYSFGELIHSLYASSRSNVFSKSLVHCILALYTVEMNQLYASCIANEGERTNEAFLAKEKLLKTINTSIAGPWTSDMLPAVYFTRVDQISKLKVPKQVDSFWAHNETSLKPIINFQADIPVAKVSDWDSILKKIVPITELAFMFFTNLNPDETFRLEVQGINEGNRKRMIVISADGICSAYFDIWNFCINSLDYERYFEKVEHMLISAFSKFAIESKNMNSWNAPRGTRLQHLIRCNSLRRKYENWNKQYGPLAIPLHQFDMAYNIFKRLADKRNNSMAKEIWDYQILQYCVKLYCSMFDKLSEQAKYYGGVVDKALPAQRFTEAFCCCPFIQIICSIFSDDNSVASNLRKMSENPAICKLDDDMKLFMKKALERFFSRIAQNRASTGNNARENLQSN